MPIRDKNLDWVRKQVYIPYFGVGMGPTIAVNEGGSTSHAAGAILPGADTGAPVQSEIGTSGITGLLMDTAGDMHAVIFPLPADLDVNQPVGVRVHWASAAAAVGARTIDWIVTYSQRALDLAIVTPATALSTVIAQDTPVGVLNAHQLTARGLIAANTFAANLWSSTAFPLLNLRAEMDAFEATFTESKWFLGWLLDYAPRRTEGGGSSRSRRFI